MEIIDVEFLTPARVTLDQDGTQKQLMVQVDLINHKIYSFTGELLDFGEDIFKFLDQVHAIPGDFFAAPEEVMRQAAELHEESDNLRNSQFGIY
jgi:hypothetical protein